MGYYKTNDMEIYNYIDQVWRETYRPPTYRDIVRNTGISSTSTIRRVAERLADRGLIMISGSALVPIWVVNVIDSDSWLKAMAQGNDAPAMIDHYDSDNTGSYTVTGKGVE